MIHLIRTAPVMNREHGMWETQTGSTGVEEQQEAGSIIEWNTAELPRVGDGYPGLLQEKDLHRRQERCRMLNEEADSAEPEKEKKLPGENEEGYCS